MKTGFRSVHPFSAFIFYLFVFAVSITATHPLTLLTAITTAFIYDIKLRGKKAVLFFMRLILPLMTASALINGLFNHSGVTVLFKLPWGNNFTFEAVVYGLIFALRAGAMLIWLFSFNEVITNDKIIYLFGRISPKTALIISMALRFIPLVISQGEEITKAHRGIGSAGASKGLIKKTNSASKRLSVLVSWTLERGIDTQQSMVARGYGLKGRTSFSPYLFTLKDALMLIFSIVGAVLYFITSDSLSALFIPEILIPFPDITGISVSVFFAFLMLMPFLYDILEEKKWSISR